MPSAAGWVCTAAQRRLLPVGGLDTEALLRSDWVFWAPDHGSLSALVQPARAMPAKGMRSQIDRYRLPLR